VCHQAASGKDFNLFSMLELSELKAIESFFTLLEQ
jgi:hypothetical protein